MEAFEDQWSATGRAAGTVVFAGWLRQLDPSCLSGNVTRGKQSEFPPPIDQNLLFLRPPDDLRIAWHTLCHSSFKNSSAQPAYPNLVMSIWFRSSEQEN